MDPISPGTTRVRGRATSRSLSKATHFECDEALQKLSDDGVYLLIVLNVRCAFEDVKLVADTHHKLREKTNNVLYETLLRL